ncbi:MAG: nucleoside deaminase [Calditrichaeota bacterium]|nr:MAG: nucleoside deaminase [Calditrichota bacterium]
MQAAIEEAKKALAKGEVPVGAVVVADGEIVGAGHNMIETFQDATAHAEMIAMNAASSRLGTWRLDDCTIYVTLEPCPMCMGAIHLARIPRLVFGARDPRLGACGSAVDLRQLKAMAPPVDVKEGVLADTSRELLQKFFDNLRNKKKQMGQ